MKEITHHHNVELMLKAFDDVCEFFDVETVRRSDLWRRYNYCAKHSDKADRMRSDDFGDLLVHACENGRLESTVFGFEKPE